MKSTNINFDREVSLAEISSLDASELQSNFHLLYRDLHLLKAAILEQNQLKLDYEQSRIDYVYVCNLIAEMISEEEHEFFNDNLPQCCEGHRQQYAYGYFSVNYNKTRALISVMNDLLSLAELMDESIHKGNSNTKNVIH